MNKIFTHRDNKEGNVGIGKLPEELHNILDDITNKYSDMIPDKTNTTYHTYYTDLSGSIKEKFDKIQYDNFWDYIENNDENNNKYIKKCVIEMNEIYYSNPKPNFEKSNLYGAAANLIPHRDCVIYNFYGISFYRIIIGLTENNNDTSTEFINFDLKHKINRGDYMIFDFGKTLHQVKKTGQQETPRLLLKIHFIVCDKEYYYSKEYMNFISKLYILYYYIARYTEQIGTDPKTFIGFFFGLIWEWPFYPKFKYILLSLLVSNVAVIKLITNDIVKISAYSTINLFNIYLLFVSFYYLRFIIWKIK